MTSFAQARNLAVAFLTVLAGAVVMAQAPQPLTLADALARAGEHAPAVEAAGRVLADAQRELELATVDPMTTRLAHAAAARSMAAAEMDLVVARATANHEVVLAYAEVLEAQAARSLASKRLELLTVTLEATKARFGAGAVTAVEVSNVESDLASQERALWEAESRLAFAEDALAALIGEQPASLAPITTEDLLAGAELEALVAGVLESSARVAAALRALETAEGRLAAADNPLSARMEIEAARQAVANAVDALAVAEATAVRDVRRARSAVTSADNRYDGARAAVASADSALAAQEARLEAGTISALAFAQSELALQAAVADEASALHDLVAAQYALRVAGVR